MNDYIIGIDLGTTNSAVAVFKTDTVEIIPNENGHRTTPSCVYFGPNENIVGYHAKDQLKKYPQNTIVGIKRFIGRKYSDHIVKKDRMHFQYDFISDSDNRPMIRVNDNNYYPEDISSIILKQLKKNAEDYLNCKIKDAIITVPAYFSDAQRQSTKDAGSMAGLNVVRIINEPTAASLAYGLHKTNLDQHILVFDLGGGTFDTTILKLYDGTFQVLATGGDTHLGGDDFDNNLVKHCLSLFIKKNKNNLLENDVKEFLSNKKAQQKLRIACEEAKVHLSNSNIATIDIEPLYNDFDFNVKISKSRFESLCEEQFKLCMTHVTKVLKDAKLKPIKIDQIVLVGGSTKIPKIKEMLQDYFETSKINNEIDPDEAVAYGAAVQGQVMSKNNDPITNEIVLLDVTPLSIGIEVANGGFKKIIKRNSPIPIKETIIFSTESDNQPEIVFKIYEGERSIAKFNNLMGTFRLNKLTQAPRGIPKIEVTCSISVDGIISISALEKITVDNSDYINLNKHQKDGIDLNNEEENNDNENDNDNYTEYNNDNEKIKDGVYKKIAIKNYRNRLSKEYIKQKLENAQKHEEEDKQYKLAIEAKTELESYLLDIENKFNQEYIRNKFNEEIWFYKSHIYRYL